MEANREQIAVLSRAALQLAEATRRGQARVFDPVRVGLLQVVVERGPLRPGEAAEVLDVVPSSVTRHVQALEEFGYIVVTADPTDRRASLIEATEAGREQLRQLEAAGLDAFCHVVADWSVEDVHTLTVLLNRLVDDWATRGVEHQRRSTRRAGGAWWRAT